MKDVNVLHAKWNTKANIWNQGRYNELGSKENMGDICPEKNYISKEQTRQAHLMPWWQER